MQSHMSSYHLFFIAYITYFAAAIGYLFSTFTRKNIPDKIMLTVMIIGITAQMWGLGYRWKEAGHAPFTNMYESLIFLTWMMATIYTIAQIYRKTPNLGSIVIPIVVLVQGFALDVVPVSYVMHVVNTLTAIVGGRGAWFPAPDRGASPLMPALMSYWLEIHVVTCFIAYGAFTLSFGTACMYLWKNHFYGVKTEDGSPVIAGGSVATHSMLSIEQLDLHTYWLTAVGFILLGIGIVTGAVWANETWGSYWTWDPKESASLVAWLIYLVYLHTRLVSRWRGPRIMWIVILGFVSVFVCYYGINMILPKYTEGGLHSYGQQ
jgi:cytochrome c-type biogenesis protein CcsB